MQSLLVQLRTMQMFYHSAHNLAGRQSFFSDHSALGDFYGAVEDDYDSVAERTIGLDKAQEVNLAQIMSLVAQKCASLPSTEVKENVEFFKVGLSLEQELRVLCSAEIKAGVTEGTRQMLGDIMNDSEMRTYKIKQRMKK